MTRVLIVATSRKTRGGITSVIKAHETGEQWKRFHCHWVQTHRDGPAWRKLLYFISGLMDFLIRLPFFDIVHIHVSQPTTIKRKQVFMRLAKIFHKKIIVHFHAFNIEETFAGPHNKQYVDFFNQADRVIVLSNWWKEQIKDYLSISDNNIIVLYNPCPEISDNTKISKKNIILYAGTITKRKGYIDLIRAFASIAPQYPDWVVIFAGNGEISEGKDLSQTLGIKKHIEFAGWISGTQKDILFRESSIFCLPSYAEGFPMAVLDAWAYGLPVITTPVGGIPDIAEDGANMLLFNPGDIKKLTENLERLITDRTLRLKISNASTAFANGKFNIETINQQLANIYDKI